MSASKPTEIVRELSADPTESHTLATRADVLVDGNAEVSLPVIDGSVTLDATAAIRGQMDLTIAAEPDLIPTSPRALLAPYGNEVQVYRGVELPDRLELVSLGIFRINAATLSDSADGLALRISGQDRAARFSGSDGCFEVPGQTTDAETGAEVIYGLLTDVWPDLPVSLNFLDSVSWTSIPPLPYAEGDDRWGFCQSLAVACVCDLYFDRNGILNMPPIPTAVSGAPVAYVSEGADLITVERDWDRDPVFNQVIVTGESSSNDTDPPRGVAYDNNPLSPTYIYSNFGRKTDFWSNWAITTNDQAEDAAAGRLARVSGAPDLVNFEAIVDPARYPGDIIRVTREQLGLTFDHVIDSVTIPLGPEGTMTAATRATAEVF